MKARTWAALKTGLSGLGQGMEEIFFDDLTLGDAGKASHVLFLGTSQGN
jgi:hypothetical protein